ncbi:asparaginase [Solitalea canadensis]|uniref:asparaginase n=1 Tax=Solitalea canadensis (strain ATCC 29591 / DSM 3403 / JCM 21819 / LMG 8368 / NBRC 15130 / NCIMB 12057 / USAM 9D) TaxID=929556 RepID=H8KN48_SOLCM|nr:type I asparaginase [Solitalea canadensis]AFD09381.1 L-asparaginase type I family protein [Solitalea canadensis DSM 3403]
MTNILIIYTGGTIGMVNDPKTGALKPFNFSHITGNVPELKRLNYNFAVHSFNPTLDSSNMTPEIWVELAVIIEDNYNKYDGFVILHGSDTMAYSASALSFALENLAKPVVFTGSQLPIGEIRTDAKENLLTALEIAAAKKDDGSAMVPEVCIYFDFMLYRGNRATKFDSEKFQAFTSTNYHPLAEAGIRLKYNEKYILPQPEKPLKVYKYFDTSVGSLKLFPGMDARFVSGVLSTPGLRAVVMEAFGSGNASTDPRFLAVLKEAINRGILILDISQCMGGTVELGHYETSNELSSMGILSGYDMTYEAAITKLMFVMAQNLPAEELKLMLSTSIRGELTKLNGQS